MPTPACRPSRPARLDSGVALLEALIGFLLLSLLLLGGLHLHTRLRQGADAARQRTEAIHLAQRTVEGLRTYAPSASAALPETVPATSEASFASTTYTLRPDLSDDPHLPLRWASVSVDWTDRTGLPGRLALHALVNQLLPLYSTVLSLRPAQPPPLGRSLDRPSPSALGAGLPPDAWPMGGGRSLWKPAGPGDAAYVLDTATGRVMSRCTVAPTARWRQRPAEAPPAHCVALDAVLVQGYVRFSLGDTPDPSHANDVPQPFDAELSLDSPGPPPACATHLLKTVHLSGNGTVRTEAVPLDSAPADFGSTRPWQETGERYASYVCVLAAADRGTGWSGRWRLRPHGWRLGTTASARKVCRYGRGPDTAEDGTGPPSAEYRDVRASLTEQNHLVIRGDLPCPQAVPSPPRRIAAQ